ncbi:MULTISPECIES: gp436 family protein [unclassified Moraxella]|uniref:gp436 family protein n=1 Tax=unclassified Moraxella TaxID=2685852 RepID=UPI003AF54C57
MNTNTYATLDAMIARFGRGDLVQITDNEPPYTGEINQIKLQLAIDSANAEVDAYLAKKLTVPTVLQSPFVQMMACDIARYHVVLGASRVSERDEKRYKLAVDNLKAVNEGKIGIGASTTTANAVPSTNLAQMTTGRPTVFGGSGW